MSDENNKAPAREGDAVRHLPTGEKWAVAAAYPDGRILCAGWPLTSADRAEYEVIERCTDEQHAEMLDRLAGMKDGADPRCVNARAKLALAPPADDDATDFTAIPLVATETVRVKYHDAGEMPPMRHEDDGDAAPPAVGEPEERELMRVVGELEKIDSALPTTWHRSYFVDSPRYRRWTEEEKRKAHESERRRIVAGGRVGESSCNAIAYVQTDDRDLIDRIVAVRNHLPTLLSAIRRLTAANAELVKERDAEKEHADRMVREVSVIARESMDRQITLAKLEAEVIASRDIVKAAESERDAAREEAKRLREALEPFVRAFMYVHRDPHAVENNPGFREFLDGNEVIPRQMSSEEVLSVGHFRHAALAMESAALSAPAGSQQEVKP